MDHVRPANSAQIVTRVRGTLGNSDTRNLALACAIIEYAAQHSTEGAIAFDVHGDCVWANRAALRMLGLNDATLVVPSLNLRSHALEGADSQLSEIERAFRGEAVDLASFGYRLPGVDSNDGINIKLDNYTRLLPLVDDSGLLERLYAFHHPASERESITYPDGSDHREVLLVHSIKTAKQILGRVTHDFNNLIAVIRGYASVLQGNPRLAEDSKQLASFIEQAGAELGGLADRLARFADVPLIELTTLNINRLVAEFLGQKRSSIPEGVDLQIDLAEPLPDLMGDKARLQEVCGHIWQNAIEAMPSGGKLLWHTSAAPVLDLTYPSEGNGNIRRYIRLRVEDSGQGMDRDALTNIFVPFFTTKSGKGRGLGAMVVYEIVKSHGGYIEVSTGAGPGSCIELYLPASDGEDQPTPEAGATHRASAPVLLVVDDDDMVRLAIQRMLDQLGYRSMAVASGEEALGIYEQSMSEIAAVILDVTMPGLGGIETFRQLRGLNSQVRIIISSGDPLNPAIRDLEAQGISYLIAKPFQVEELARAIRQTIG